MSFYGSRVTHFVEGKTEEEVRKKLIVIGGELQQKLEVINVYYNAGKGRVIAWYFHDIKAAPLPPTGESKPIKKTKKKVTKKA